YDVPIPADTRAAELQDLAGSLNRMSDAFRAKISELQRMAHIQSEFIGNVSHEVRNPIFAVGGYLEALAAPLPDAQRKRYAEKALAALGRLQALFNDLIEIARLEHRSEDLLRPSNFNLSDLLDEVCEMLRPRADEKALTLTFETPPGVYVHADRNRIRQVLVNLVENAIAYTDEGTVTARIYPRGDRVRVEVMDTGKGIPPDAQERIFERFYRVDPDRSRKSGGTGLGLSIVKQILHAHGTPVRLDSTPGKGSRFWFELPVAAAPAAVEMS
ncbi:MAG TPA: HAMP domain-containing sensor histidine kinase, partial [Rhodothermales bacterium]|nr:HAMP domain-containing sensor histidine kinase [Rhodothermales bacterium]